MSFYKGSIEIRNNVERKVVAGRGWMKKFKQLSDVVLYNEWLFYAGGELQNSGKHKLPLWKQMCCSFRGHYLWYLFTLRMSPIKSSTLILVAIMTWRLWKQLNIFWRISSGIWRLFKSQLNVIKALFAILGWLYDFRLRVLLISILKLNYEKLISLKYEF